MIDIKQFLMLACAMAQGTIMCMKTPAQALTAFDADLSAIESHAKWLNIKIKQQRDVDNLIKLVASTHGKTEQQALAKTMAQSMEILELLYQNKIDLNVAINRMKTIMIALKQTVAPIKPVQPNQAQQQEFAKANQEHEKLLQELKDPSIWPSKTLYDQYWRIDAELSEIFPEEQVT